MDVTEAGLWAWPAPHTWKVLAEQELVSSLSPASESMPGIQQVLNQRRMNVVTGWVTLGKSLCLTR